MTDGIFNDTEQPLAMEDITTMEKESYEPYPVINTVDAQYHPIIKEDFSSRFNAIWNAIKEWDIKRTGSDSHSGAMGSDVMSITHELDKLNPKSDMDIQIPLTFGQKAAGVSFNPGGHPEVNRVKAMFAELIDVINDLRAKAESPDAKRYYSTAITEAEKSQMLAVKAITWQY